MSNEAMHLVVEIGGEGGSLSLFAGECSAMPAYVLSIVDQSLLFIGEGDEIKGERGRATTWRGALKLLDTYPWHMLVPLQVRPEYRKRILSAVTRRLAKERSPHAESRLERWRTVCLGREE